MCNKNSFNLIDEPWIPICKKGLVSLSDIFTNTNNCDLGGTPLQKISVLKFLLAIAQAACTPETETDWGNLGPQGVGRACLLYLEKWREKFWLYGEYPFLQLPQISNAKKQPFGALMPEVATGNTVVFTETQVEKKLEDADKALLLVSLMGCAFAGKKTDNNVVLSTNYSGKKNEKGKESSGKPGPFLGVKGYLHSFLLGEYVLKTLWLNLFTFHQIRQLEVFSSGLGSPPWEKMPEGEVCATAELLKTSLMGCLVPLSRFCLLESEGMRYTEGISYLSHKEGALDPSMALDTSKKPTRAIWSDPDKRPWRYLTALLQFISSSSRKSGFDCLQIKNCLPRIRDHQESVRLWSGGIRLSFNGGEQFVSGSDDFVESIFVLKAACIGEVWYERLKAEVGELEELSRELKGKIDCYFKDQKMQAKSTSSIAVSEFWQLCENSFQELINVCDSTGGTREMRNKFASHALQVYDRFCGNETARQMEYWVKNRPHLKDYIFKNTRGE